MTRLKDIRLIALDLDDTTLRSDGSLSGQTRAAIEAAIDAGLEIVIASGRALHSLPKAVTEIPGIRYAVTERPSSASRTESALSALPCTRTRCMSS